MAAARPSSRSPRPPRSASTGSCSSPTTATPEPVRCDDRAAWRAWLVEHHASADGVWLVTPKAASRLPRVTYDEAVEEALCVGWVDSRSRRVDDELTSILFTPRRERSPWSASNVARVEALEAAGSMLPAGRAAVERARAAGLWPG